jgi:NitT/TauT family transport system permease protein
MNTRRAAFAVPPFVYPLVSLIVVIAIWQAAVRLFAIPDYILPSPKQVFEALAGGFADGRTSARRCSKR